MRARKHCPECYKDIEGKQCDNCGWSAQQASDSARGFWAQCAKCRIDLPPHKQVMDRQKKGEPVAQGYLCGTRGNEYYLCGVCLTEHL
jgi:hypothetical protein